MSQSSSAGAPNPNEPRKRFWASGVLASPGLRGGRLGSTNGQSKASVHHSCGIPKDVNLFAASSHMHSHGVHYIARSSDGQLLYETNEWAEPQPWTFSPPRLLHAGSTIDVTCDYDNQTDQPLSFGESAATNEMCIFVGAYYPAGDGESITCLF